MSKTKQVTASRPDRPVLRLETMRLREVAETLGVTYATAHEWHHDGILPGKKVGGIILIPRAVVERLIAEVNAAGEKSAVE